MELKNIFSSAKKAVYKFAVLGFGCGCCDECNGCGLRINVNKENEGTNHISKITTFNR